MIGKGVFKVDLGNGKGEACFHFGTLAAVYAEEKLGVPVSTIFKEIATARTLLYYFWSGAVAYNEINGIKEDITIAKVSEWMDELGLEKLFEIYSASIKGPESKNGVAPREAEQAA